MLLPEQSSQLVTQNCPALAAQNLLSTVFTANFGQATLHHYLRLPSAPPFTSLLSQLFEAFARSSSVCSTSVETLVTHIANVLDLFDCMLLWRLRSLCTRCLQFRKDVAALSLSSIGMWWLLQGMLRAAGCRPQRKTSGYGTV